MTTIIIYAVIAAICCAGFLLWNKENIPERRERKAAALKELLAKAHPQTGVFCCGSFQTAEAIMAEGKLAITPALV